MSTIDYGHGTHDLTGAYRLVPDGGQWFVMGNNMSVPCDSLEQANEIYQRLTGRDAFESKPATLPADERAAKTPSPSGIGRSSFQKS